jgi:polyvinyl alcohol dehydrogenase (cytochrome)
MRLILLVAILLVSACGSGSSSVADGNDAAETELPFQSYSSPPQPRGGECEDTIDTDAPIIANGFGFDLKNSRNQASTINAGNVATLALNYSSVRSDISERRGAPAVTAQAIFLSAGDQLLAINRASGCRYWSFTAADSGSGLRSASINFVPGAEGKPAMVFAGDFNGNVHALDAKTGALLWQAFAGSDPALHFITGGLQYYRGVLFVPVSSKEVISGAFATGPCCTSHGMLLAFDAYSGERLWQYHTTADADEVILPGERIGPNGAPVWSTPTIDSVRNALYIGTGQNYTEPTTATSDAIISLDIDSGEVNWIFQATANDAWNYACEFNNPLRCPDPEGHDFDFGAAPMLAASGDALIAGDKGGMVYAINPDNGDLLWSRKVSIGSKLGGIHWGMALDASRIYVAATDFEIDTSSGDLEDLIPGANPGIYALDFATGALVWEIHPQRDYEGLQTPVLFSASLSVTNDVLFAGSLDGIVSAFAVADGRELWSFDTAVAVSDINNIAGAGGTIDSVGVVVAGMASWLTPVMARCSAGSADTRSVPATRYLY